MDLNYANFIPQLIKVVPEFEPTYQEHLHDNHGKLLPHVLMGDFTRFLFAAYKKSVADGPDNDRWRQVVTNSLELLELAIQSPKPGLSELIGASFVENMRPSHKEDIETYHALKALLGPALRKQLAYYDPL